jgi:hypothetical protein
LLAPRSLSASGLRRASSSRARVSRPDERRF